MTATSLKTTKDKKWIISPGVGRFREEAPEENNYRECQQAEAQKVPMA